MSKPGSSDVTRRIFLKQMAVGGAVAASSYLLPGNVSTVFASGITDASSPGILIDLTRCVGCNSCALACKESNNLPHPEAVPDSLQADVYTFVEEYAVVNAQGESESRYVKRQCMHCLDPACVSACPAAAMYKSAEGPVVYRVSRCLGCRYCEVACPFGVPRFEWEDGLDPTINKCWFCYDRLREGQKPACVEACPVGALHFGEREKLLAQAHGLIASNGDRYINHVFGEFEVGGTSMLYLSDVPFDQLGFPGGLSNTAPPEQTEKIVTKLPFVLAGMAVLMTGSAAYTHRKPQSSKNSVGPESMSSSLDRERQEE